MTQPSTIILSLKDYQTNHSMAKNLVSKGMRVEVQDDCGNVHYSFSACAANEITEFSAALYYRMVIKDNLYALIDDEIVKNTIEIMKNEGVSYLNKYGEWE